MYKMISEYGNVIKFVDEEIEKENLEALGFKEEKHEILKKSNLSPKRGKKNVKKNN